MKLIHCADLHFDTPFSGLDDAGKAEIRREDLRRTFSEILSLAVRERADALLVAGDLFDSACVSERTLSFLRAQLGAVPQLRVFLCGGNHDPFTASSYYQILDWPENVHIFGTQIESVELPDARIYGVSMAGQHQQASPLAGFCAEDDGKISVMVMHGELVAGNGASEYCPVRMAEIEHSGLDYLALGHVHQFSGALRAGTVTYAYPGCPEGRGFDELGEKGVIIADVTREAVSVQFVPLCRRRYFEAHVDVTGLEDYSRILEAAREAMEGTEEDLYKIVLDGSTPQPISTAVLRDGLDAFEVRVRDHTKPELDADSLEDDFSIRGMFAREILKRPESETARMALQYGLSALAGEKVDVL